MFGVIKWNNDKSNQYLRSCCGCSAASGAPHLLKLHPDLSKRLNDHSYEHILKTQTQVHQCVCPFLFRSVML